MTQSVYLRAKECPKELRPRCDLVCDSFTINLDLGESALCPSSTGDWERLRSYPMIVETFCDRNETRQSLFVIAIGARQRRNRTTAVGHAHAAAFSKILKIVESDNFPAR